ncbi:MAG: septal ring lytic transglycosylase RlpA family protein [bacterium]
MRIRILLAVVALLLASSGCASLYNYHSYFSSPHENTYEGPYLGNRFSPSREGDAYEGIASWYGPGFHGRRTANGEIYDMWSMTAAHKTLPLGSEVRVTNLENGRSVVVRINDRGPYAAGRIIDLSRAAAQALGFVDEGTARVRIEVLKMGDNEYRKQ